MCVVCVCVPSSASFDGGGGGGGGGVGGFHSMVLVRKYNHGELLAMTVVMFFFPSSSHPFLCADCKTWCCVFCCRSGSVQSPVPGQGGIRDGGKETVSATRLFCPSYMLRQLLDLARAFRYSFSSRSYIYLHRHHHFVYGKSCFCLSICLQPKPFLGIYVKSCLQH